MSTIKRIDPTECGCTDCIMGYSKPLDQCSETDLYLSLRGNIKNASGETFELRINIKEK